MPLNCLSKPIKLIGKTMSTHPIEPWKLTAFALNELEADERRAMEEAIAADPTLQTEVDSLRAVIDKTSSALAKASIDLGLGSEQIAKIEQAIQNRDANETVKLASASGSSKTIWSVLAALAACVLVAFLLLPSMQNAREAARRSSAYYLPDQAEYAADESAQTASAPVNSNKYLEDDSRRYGQASGGQNAQAVDKNSESDLSLTLSAPLETNGLSNEPSPPAPLPEDRERGGEIAVGSSQVQAEVRARGVDAKPSSRTENSSAPMLAKASDEPTDRAGVAEIAEAPKKQSERESVELQLGKRDSYDLKDRLADGTQQSASGTMVSPAPVAASSSLSTSEYGLAPTSPASGPSGNASSTSGGTGDALACKEAMGVEFDFSVSDKSDATLMQTATPRIIIPEEESVVYAERRGFVDHNPDPRGDRFEPIVENPFLSTSERQYQLSTFSIDVDTASYSKIRQYLMQANALPTPNSVRIEEMINYFDYDYAGPEGEHPFASHMAVGPCPWNESHRLVRIGLQAKKIDFQERPKANLVFLLDVSGSMDEPNKLPLVKQSIAMLARQLGENDRIAMVVYAGAAGCVLPSTTGDKQTEILDALDRLQAGGSTNGGQGIELAYQIAREHFVKGGINRVILCTDGDFNVGTTSNEGLIKLVESNAKSKVFLTCLGYGMGNYNDSMMEQITNRGNGTYGMVDNIREARRLMVEQLSSTIMTVAKDVKIQVEFNPTKIAKYRLVGYENRKLANEDFNNDAKDAGEIGAGHRVTALYEIIPVGAVDNTVPPVDEFRYGRKPESSDEKKSDEVSKSEGVAFGNEWLTLKLRYKQPEGDVSTKFESFLTDADVEKKSADADYRWTACVAEFGLLLRHSRYAPQADWDRMIRRAQEAAGDNVYRLECIAMMIKAQELAKR
jgi:Ca-activated chloride channel family protein